MADLEYEVADLDAVDEGFRDMYQEGTNEDGDTVHRLSIKGLPDTQGLKSALQKERQNVKKLRSDVRAFEGVDVDEYSELKSLREKFEKGNKGKVDESTLEAEVEKRLKRHTEEHGKQLEKLTTGIQSRDAKLSQLLIDNAIAKAVSDPELGVNETALEDIQRRAKDIFKVIEGEVKPLDTNGDVMYGKDGIEPLKIGEWLSDIRDKAPHLFKGSTGGGSKGGQADKSGGRSTTGKVRARSDLANAGERSAFIAEHGMDAYLNLPLNNQSQ